jgi:uncharacterized membrane protein
MTGERAVLVAHGDPDEAPGRAIYVPIRRAARWMVRPPCYLGLVGAVWFFALTMTPSLVPRGWVMLGVLSGLTAAIGYGLGSATSSIARWMRSREPGSEVKRRAWIGLAVGGPMLILVSLWAGSQWDGDLRVLMEMPLQAPWKWLSLVMVSVVSAAILLLVGRVIRGVGHLVAALLGRLLPRPLALSLGVVAAVAFTVYVVLGGLFDTAYQAINTAAGIADRTIHPDIPQPSSPFRSGSPDSLISWDQLGAKGREFTGTGPTVDELTAFAGQTALEPIRVYAGLRSASSTEGRVALLMRELDRTDAWGRSVIIVQIPSGNGEIPLVNADAPEYMFAGDTASVVIQYSYVPSWVSLMSQPEAGNDAAAQLITAVTERVASMPEPERPQVFVQGESLGSLSAEAAFADLDDLVARVDGALLVGPTFLNQMRQHLTSTRDAGSPVWRPVVDGGARVRFAQLPQDLAFPAAPWTSPRVVYLMNASDPVAWFAFDSMWARPRYLDKPRGPDVSPSMTWIPVVTFWQTVLDLMAGSAAPAGHGHSYGVNIVDGWAAVLQPTDWTAQDTARLRDLLAEELANR